MSLRTSFYNDPFFSNVDLPQALSLEHRSRSDHRDRQLSQRHENSHQEMDVFGNPFVFMQTMMNNMGQMMSQMETRMNSADFDGQMGPGLAFSSSTVMTMDRSNGGQPRIVQATSERLRGPEGLERTRKAVRDTGRNLEKMEVAHRLGERAHRITKERDPNTGHLLENREFEHIDDEHDFEREWMNRAERIGLKNGNGLGFSSQTNNLLMTPPAYGRLRSQSQGPRQLAIEQPSSSTTKSRHHERRRK